MSDAVGSIRNISGDDRTVPGLGGRLVLAGQGDIAVPLDQVILYTQQESIWAPDDAAAQAEHDAMLAAIAELLAAEAEASGLEPPKKKAAKKAASGTANSAQEG